MNQRRGPASTKQGSNPPGMEESTTVTALEPVEPSSLWRRSPSPRAEQRVPKAPRTWAWLGLVPLFAFLLLFLVAPALSVFNRAITGNDGNRGFTALGKAFSGQNLDAFKFSVWLSFWAALAGVVLGSLLAYATTLIKRPRWLRSIITSFSGVAANLGGIPLAFAFVALLGRQGLLTKILDGLFHFKLYGTSFALDSTWGLTVVYSYFNIPLMVLITLPAIDGLKVSWREACANLGGTSLTYWRRVGIPVLTPSLLGGFLLLFANSFSAYATAAALTSKSSIVPLRIGFYLRGDISANEDQLGFALAMWMIIIMTVCMGAYWLLRKRAERWQQ
jgi:putative spermidine/putrescine transport system permease protein